MESIWWSVLHDSVRLYVKDRHVPRSVVTQSIEMVIVVLCGIEVYGSVMQVAAMVCGIPWPIPCYQMDGGAVTFFRHYHSTQDWYNSRIRVILCVRPAFGQETPHQSCRK